MEEIAFRGAGDIFAAGDAQTISDKDNCDKLYQQIDRLQVENYFLKKKFLL